MQHLPAPRQTDRQDGYTIVELSIALAIIGILLVAGLSGVSSLIVTSKANTQIEDSSRAMGKLQGNLTSTGVSSMTPASAIGWGIFPSSRVSGTAVTTAMGGGNEFVASNAAELIIGTNNIALTANSGLVYTLTNIPKAACSDIVVSLASLANAAYVYTGGALTAGNEGAIGNLTTGNQIKAPGAAVQGVKMGTQCNVADTVNLAFILRP